MAANKKTFIFYSDWANMIREMPNNDAGELIKHMLAYVNDEDPQTDNILVKMAFGHIKPMLKADLIKWEEIRGKRKEAGKKGGQASGKQKKANGKQTEAVNVNVNVNANEKVNDNKGKKFTRPSFEEVFNYMVEKGMSPDIADTQSQKFINHYDSNGWKVGDNKMVKWRSAVSGNWLVDKYSSNGQTEYTFDEVVAAHNNPRDKLNQQDFECFDKENKLWKLKQ